MVSIALPDRRTLALTVMVAVGYAFVSLLFDKATIAAGIVGVWPAAAYPVVFGLLFGLVACFGTAVGVVLTHAIRGAVGVPTLFVAIGMFVFGAVSIALWGNLGPLSGNGYSGSWSASQVIEFVLVVFGAAVSSASVMGWGFELLNLYPFYLTAMSMASTLFLSTLVFGTPLLYVLSFRRPNLILDVPEVRPTKRIEESFRWLGTGLKLVVVMIAWFAFGISSSLVIRIFKVIPEPSLAKHTFQIVALWKDPLLWAGWLLQLLIGMVAFYILIRYSEILLRSHLIDQ